MPKEISKGLALPPFRKFISAFALSKLKTVLAAQHNEVEKLATIAIDHLKEID
jgi:hypothetical protein